VIGIDYDIRRIAQKEVTITNVIRSLFVRLHGDMLSQVTGFF